ncbi:hypothetical protein RCC89_09840 [Cytophagaceae bacterium ABcell3]|nr:hypothetical protein RCC89_09840 [Cytophagaceae bacterium ABcell3]
MVINKKITSVALVAGLLSINGCALKQMIKMSKDQELQVQPSPLEVHGDSVSFEMSALLPVKMLKKNKIYTVNAYYEHNGEKIKLEEVEFKSNDYPDANMNQPKLSHRYSFGYDPEIGNGDLIVVGTASNMAKSRSKSTDELPLAKGLITTSTLVKDIYHVAYADHGYDFREELIPTTVNFFFDQGRSNLKASEISGEEGKKLNAYLAQNNVTRTVTIIGQHSPEGSETKNSKLADERALVIEKHYRQAMKKYDHKKVADSIKFVTKGVVMDWAGLKKELEKTSAINDDQKAQVLEIIDGKGSFADKQKEIEKLSFYKTLLNKVYPNLRTARTEILTVKPKKSNAEISLLASAIVEGKANADTLSYEELAYAATLTNDLELREKIYVATIKKKDSWDSHNNLGAVYLEMAKKELNKNERAKLAEKAINQFELSNKLENNAYANTNLASALLMTGKKTEGVQAINKAATQKADNELKKGIAAVQGTLEIKEAKYKNAVQNLSKANETAEVLYNLALASLLNKDYQAAKKTFDAAISADENNALAHYGAAVTAARLNDEASLTSNLKKAVKLDEKLNERAVTDMEFADFANSQNFKNALK